MKEQKEFYEDYICLGLNELGTVMKLHSDIDIYLAKHGKRVHASRHETHKQYAAGNKINGEGLSRLIVSQVYALEGGITAVVQLDSHFTPRPEEVTTNLRGAFAGLDIYLTSDTTQVSEIAKEIRDMSPLFS